MNTYHKLPSDSSSFYRSGQCPGRKGDRIPMSLSSMASESASIGPQDCRTCKRRRITCDRGLPGCFKCSKKGYSCPGYDRHLRWVNGVAVRGHSRGLRRPLSPGAIPSPRSRSQRSQKSLPQPEDTTFFNEKTANSWAADLSAYGESNFPDAETIAYLLDHYDKKISRIMVWIDSDQNGYRRLVLPLARQQPVLLLSILAVSGNHLARTTKIESSFPKSACDTAVTLITNQVQRVTNRLAEGRNITDEIDTATAEWMLASMLTLSMYGMVESDSAEWHSHRQAARTLVKVLETSEQPHTELYVFLRNMLSVDDVLASTTSFDLESMANVILPEGENDVLFGAYLRIIHQVTALTRGRSNRQAVARLEDSATKLSGRVLRSRFELARGYTLTAFGALHKATTTDTKQRDFIRLTDAYHHAGLLYSYRCLRLPDIAWNREYSMGSLQEVIEDIEDIAESAHYLPWPLFILGTESKGSPQRKEFLRRAYQSMIEHLGFGQYVIVLRFLEEFWAGDDDEEWLTLAKVWEEKGLRLFIL